VTSTQTITMFNTANMPNASTPQLVFSGGAKGEVDRPQPEVSPK